MAAIERQTTIDAPVDAVFSYVADLTRHPEWAGHQLQIEKTSEGPVGVGATFASIGHQMGRNNEDRVTVTEFVPNESIAFEAEGGAGRVRHFFQLRQQDGGTVLTKGTEALQLSFPFSLLFPLVRMMGGIATGLDGDLKRIKAKLEAAPAPEAAAPPPAPAESETAEPEEPTESA